MEKFVEITRKDKGFNKENSWLRSCRETGIPCVTLKARSKLAMVQWDYMSYPADMDDLLFALHEQLKVEAQAIYDRYKSKDTWFSAGPGVIAFRNLALADAREAASELFDVIYQSVSEGKLVRAKPH